MLGHGVYFTRLEIASFNAVQVMFAIATNAVVLKLWYAKTYKVVREEAYFLFFFTKNIFTAVVFTCRVLLINS